MSAVAESRAPFVRGWITVVICLLGISTGPAAFALASIGIVAEPLSQEFGWSRTAISSPISVMMLCTAACMPIAGKLVDKFGAKRVLVPSVIALALCLLLLPMVHAYWQFMALFAGMGTIAVGSNSVPYMRVLAHWFDRRRGLAIGIAGSGTGLGFAYVPLVTEALVSHYGWRAGYVGLGLIMLLFTLPMILFLLKEFPQQVGLQTDGAANVKVQPKIVAEGDDLRQAARKRDFWSLMMIFVGLAFVLYGLIPHLVPMLTDRGVPASLAAQVASIFGLAAFGGRILIGFLVDRFDARRVALFFFSLSAFGLVLFSMPLPYWAFIGPALLLGGSLGAEVDMLAYLTSRYFGLKNFAQLFGVLFAAVLVAMGMGPVAFGAVFDHTGSYQAIVLGLGVPVCILASVLVLLLRPYAEKARGAAISVT